MTFFTTLPPVLKLSPKPDTACAPSRWSRAPPALMRRGPASPAAIMPPMVPSSARAEQRRGIHRLEGELLVLGIDQRQHVGERRAGLDRDDQLVRLVGGDGIERREVEHGIGRHRLADPALGAMTDDLERLLIGDRRAHHLLRRPWRHVSSGYPRNARPVHAISRGNTLAVAALIPSF